MTKILSQKFLVHKIIIVVDYYHISYIHMYVAIYRKQMHNIIYVHTVYIATST